MQKLNLKKNRVGSCLHLPTYKHDLGLDVILFQINLQKINKSKVIKEGVLPKKQNNKKTKYTHKYRLIR